MSLLINTLGQHTVFVMRTSALYMHDARILFVLCALVLAEMGIFLWALTREVYIPPPTTMGCYPASIKQGADGLLMWASNFAIDLVVLVLTLIKTIQYCRQTKEPANSTGSRIRVILTRDGVGYFVIITLLNILGLVFFIVSLTASVSIIINC